MRIRRLVIAAAAAVVAAAAPVAAVLAQRPPALRVLTTAQITARVNPALVDITATLGYQGAVSAGTGVVLTRSGLVLTNNHVIEGATAIVARDTGNGRTYQAAVAGYDERHDLAVLRLRGASGLTAVPLAAGAYIGVGDQVVALGNAGGTGGTPAAVCGRVTGLGETIVATDESSGTIEQLAGMIRTSARVRPGYSGGPLVSSTGQVIGINTAGSQPPGQQALSYQIPAGQAAPVAEQIRAGRPSATVHIGATAFLGVGLADHSPVMGALATTVAAGSPAATAGLARGDLITALGGHTVTSAAGLRSALIRRHPGDRVSIRWTGRGGRVRHAKVTLATGPAG